MIFTENKCYQEKQNNLPDIFDKSWQRFSKSFRCSNELCRSRIVSEGHNLLADTSLPSPDYAHTLPLMQREYRDIKHLLFKIPQSSINSKMFYETFSRIGNFTNVLLAKCANFFVFDSMKCKVQHNRVKKCSAQQHVQNVWYLPFLLVRKPLFIFQR